MIRGDLFGDSYPGHCIASSKDSFFMEIFISFQGEEPLKRNKSGQIIYFTNIDFPEIRGFPFLSYLLR